MLTVKDLLSAKAKKWLLKFLESEYYASRLYTHVANNEERLGYFGANKYYLKESEDELRHVKIIIGFYNQMGCVAPTPKTEAIADEVKSLGDALQLQMEAEYDLLKEYEAGYKDLEETDPIVAQFLLQFIQIQYESYGEVGDLISRYNRCGTNEAAILEFDEYLSEK